MNPLAVVFIHGNHKKADSWNVTESGKIINIEKSIKKVKTFLIQIDDFTVPPVGLISLIKDEMTSYRWIIVCHSLGIIHCYEFTKHLNIAGICFIDCTPLDNVFLQKLENLSLIEYIKGMKWNLSPRIICHVHLDYNNVNMEQFNRKIEYLTPFIRKNDKSKIIIHPDKGHMIHYTDGPKIIDSINQLIKN